MSSDRDDGRRHGGGAGGTAGQGDQPSPGRETARLNDLRARMRAIESGARAADAQPPSRGSLFSGAGDDVADAAAAATAPGESPAQPGAEAPAGSEAAHRHEAGHRPGARAHRAEPVADAQGDASHDGCDAERDADRDGSGAHRAAHRNGSDAAPRPAQSAAETVFEHPFADGDGHLFDQSTSAADRGRRRRAPREQSPTQRALGLLVRREHSRKELTRKLTSRGLDREQVVDAVDRLAEAGWQDDERFAETLVRSRANNGYGPVHIRAELGTHGLDSEAIAAALSGYEGDWLENARGLLRRRFGEAYADDLARRRKAADLLMRRGFELETIRIASRSYVSD